jgi:hypothetical protein
MPEAASPASYKPPLSPMRGSPAAARGFEKTEGGGGGAGGAGVPDAAGGVVVAVCPAQSTANATGIATAMTAALRQRLEVRSMITFSP